MVNKEVKRLAVFDFDGTLFFSDAALIKAGLRITDRLMTREQIRGLPEDIKSVIYDAAAHYINEYTPNQRIIDRLIDRHMKGYKIVILTARRKSSESDTLKMLKREDIPYDELRHDPALVRMKDEEFKLEELQKVAPGYAEVEIYEDKEDNISYFKDHLGICGFSYYLVTNKGKLLRR